MNFRTGTGHTRTAPPTVDFVVTNFDKLEREREREREREILLSFEKFKKSLSY